MNLDKTYCSGEPNGFLCKLRENCGRWIAHYEVPEDTMVLMMNGDDPCIDFEEIDSEVLDG
jgi:hypothetical protein